jgi:PIN domain nuclease of toxin-antitoxin system
MNYLLDTHVFIWMNEDLSKLSTTVQDIVADEANTLFFSVASIWEIQIKLQIGKLTFKRTLSEMIQLVRDEKQVEVLPVQQAHALKVGELPLLHKDPFDRLLVAQAIVEDFTLITKEPILSRYEANVIW